jgi:hypothetical protein
MSRIATYEIDSVSSSDVILVELITSTGSGEVDDGLNVVLRANKVSSIVPDNS